MNFINRILLCFTVTTRFTFGTDAPYEVQSLSSMSSYAEMMTWLSNVSEQAMSIFQGLGCSIYKQRSVILAPPLTCIAVTEFPMAHASFELRDLAKINYTLVLRFLGHLRRNFGASDPHVRKTTHAVRFSQLACN